jgi:hypothetical protein
MFYWWIQTKLNKKQTLGMNSKEKYLPQNTSVDYLYVEEENHV